MAEHIRVTLSPKQGLTTDATGERVFQEHGIEIVKHEEHWVFIFPLGTTRAEIFPRMQWTERYQLVCPDGFIVQETLSYWPPSVGRVLSYHPNPPSYEVWAGSLVLHSGRDLQEATRLYQQAGFDRAYRKKQISLLENGVPIGIMHPVSV